MLLPVLGAAAASAGAVSVFAWAARGKSSSLFAPSVWRGPRSRHAIALTFDDGPSESTPRILELLAAHSTRATFFMCGANVARLPAIARAAAAAGHEIANHSYSHSRFDFRARQFMRVDIGDAQQAISAGWKATSFVCVLWQQHEALCSFCRTVHHSWEARAAIGESASQSPRIAGRQEKL